MPRSTPGVLPNVVFVKVEPETGPVSQSNVRVVTDTAVRYVVSGDNSLLRYALWEVSKQKCYVCSKPLELAETQIDHIIPHAWSEKEQAKAVEEAAMGDKSNFDVHRPCNLAPICAVDNQRKSDRGLVYTRLFAIYLDDAKKLEPSVDRRVQSLRSGTALDKSFNAILSLDPTAASSVKKNVLTERAPALVQKLANMELSIVESYEISQVVTIDGMYESEDVRVVLDADSRRAVIILEDACGVSLPDALADSIRELHRIVAERVQGDIEAECDYPYADVSDPSGDVEVDIRKILFEREASCEFTFTILGRVDVQMSASLSVVGQDGETEFQQGDSWARGEYMMSFFWSEESGIDNPYAYIEEWNSESSVF